MNATDNNTEPTEKSFLIATETRTFEIVQTDMGSDGSFPNARQIKGSDKAKVTAKAKRKIALKSACRCGHGILDHQTDSTSLIMFFYGEYIPINRFRYCSVERCHCKHFVSIVGIKALEEAM